MKLAVLKLSDAWSFTAEAANLLAVSAELVSRGHRVVIACKPGSPLSVRAHEAGLDVREVHGFRAGWNVFAHLAAYPRVARLIRDVRPHIVHAYRSPVHSLAVVARRMSKHPVPIVRTRANVVRPRSAGLNRKLYDEWTARTIVSGEVVRNLLLEAGLGSERIVIVPGAVDTKRFDPDRGARASVREELELSDVVPVVGCVARLAPVKGHRVLLQALAQLPDVHLLLVGPPWPGMPEKVEGWGREAGVWDRVTWTGGRDDVERMISAFDVGVIASVGSEALSRAALEYMAMAVPVVATRVGGIPEIVPETAGRLVPPQDPQALAEGVRAVLDLPPSEREAMGAAGRAHVVAQHTVSRQVDRLLEIYADVLEA